MLERTRLGAVARFSLSGGIQATVVTLGDDDGTTIEVLSGLAPDDSVVLNPRNGFEESTTVVAAGDQPH
jgi:hypothetical protein